MGNARQETRHHAGDLVMREVLAAGLLQVCDNNGLTKFLEWLRSA